MPKPARHGRLPIAALVTATGFTLAAPAHADNDAQQDCTAKEWPQPLPNAVGRQLEDNAMRFASQLRECLRGYKELLSGRALDVSVERIRLEHAGE